MKKAIILLSGIPEAKTKFINEVYKSNWVWNINFRDFLGAKAKGFYWDGERDENYYNFTLEFLKLVNNHFQAEGKYLAEKIDKFLADDVETKEHEGKIFNNHILIAHGVSKELIPVLEAEYGVFKIHVSRKDLNTNIEIHDLVLYEDDDNFETEVNRVIQTLAK